MSYVIHILETAAGVATEFDNSFVKAYDPAWVHPDGYDGGILEVTQDPAEAMQFPTMLAAYRKWKEAYGMREDGMPNRPLTAWMVLFEGNDDEERMSEDAPGSHQRTLIERAQQADRP